MMPHGFHCALCMSIVEMLNNALVLVDDFFHVALDGIGKVALVPGGPHPYFAAWEQAGKDAMKDFNLGAGDYRVPAKWELALQSTMLESLITEGKIAHFTAFLVDPNTQLRIDAVQKAADETNGAVTVVQVIADIDAPEPANEKINA